MKFPKMHKPSFMAFCLAMALVGCDEKHPELPDPGGRVSTQMSFSLPGSLFRLETKHNESTNGKLDYYFSPTIWRPTGWSLWVASNVYSDAKNPGSDPGWKMKWREGRTAVVRSTHDDSFLSGVKAFIKANKIDLEINYLGYDYLPRSLVTTIRDPAASISHSMVKIARRLTSAARTTIFCRPWIGTAAVAAQPTRTGWNPTSILVQAKWTSRTRRCLSAKVALVTRSLSFTTGGLPWSSW